MNTRPHRPGHTVVVYGASGGVGTTTVAAALAMLTQAGYASGHTVLVDFDSRAFDTLGQPPYSETAGPGDTHHRRVHPGIDVVCWPGASFDPLALPAALAADPAAGSVNGVIVDATTPAPAAMEALTRHHPSVRTVLVTTNSYPAAAAARDHVAASGAHPDEIVVVEDPAKVFGMAHLAATWPAGTQLRPLRRDSSVAEVVDAGLFGLTDRTGVRVFPTALAALQGSVGVPAGADRRRVWDALHASRPDSAEAAAQLRDWAQHLDGAAGLFAGVGRADAGTGVADQPPGERCALCSAPSPGHDAGCPARAVAPAQRPAGSSRGGLSLV